MIHIGLHAHSANKEYICALSHTHMAEKGGGGGGKTNLKARARRVDKKQLAYFDYKIKKIIRLSVLIPWF